MLKHGQLSAMLCVLLALSFGCAGRVQDVESPYLADLERLEARLGQARTQSAFESEQVPFQPTGLYVEGDTIWVYSEAQPRQLGYILKENGFQGVGERRGPRETTRCVVGYGGFQGQTLCLGRSEVGGVISVNGAEFAGALEARGGFRDLAQVDAATLQVIDDLRHRLLALDAQGHVRWSTPIPAGSYRVGALSAGSSFVLSATRPHLSAFDASGRRSFASARRAPLRAAVQAQASGWLLSVGPQDALVRRRRGPIEHLGSELVSIDVQASGRGFGAGSPLSVNFGALGLADPTDIASGDAGVAVTLTGSDRVWLSGAAQSASVPGAPWAVAALRDGFVGVSRLDDRLWFLRATDLRPRHSVQLDPSPRDDPASVGERLFYSSAFWQAQASAETSAPFTCNSCHWNTESDGRRHPGFLERRWEITRGLDGIGAVRPIFSTGGAKSLSRAIEGLIRGLDERMWSEGATGYWDAPLTLQLKAEQRTLTPRAVREALLTFLMRLPSRPGPLAHTRGPRWDRLRVQGAELFARDCASCHLPVASMRRPTQSVDLRDWMSASGWLKQPLTWGAPAFSDAGSGARFTPNGNRISPLLGIGRRAPLYVTGRARDLQQLIREATPRAATAHGGRQLAGALAAPTYDASESEALLVFLASL